MPLDLPSNPRLLLTTAAIEDVKNHIRNHDWASKCWDALEQSLMTVLDDDVVLPPRGGGWGHWYVCPTHGARLQSGNRVA